MAAHLAACDGCREEFVEVGEVVRSANGSRRRRWVAAALGAAAVLALVLLQPWEGDEATSPETFREGFETASGAGIEVVRPDERVTPEDDAAFVWRSVDAGAVYRFTLVSDDGTQVFSTTTTDTTLTLREELALSDGELYWVVDALLPDGRTVSSGAQRLPRAP